MPPAAISRSSTYLAKIRGSICSCWPAAAATLALLAGCDTEPDRVAIVAHYVPACAPAPDSAPEQLELIALGDFDRSNDSVSILSSGAALQTLALPEDTRAVELSTLGGRGYWGTGELDAQRAIPVLLWPRQSACPIGQLTAAAESGEWLFGLARPAWRVFGLAGLPDPAGAAPGLQLDLRTGQLTLLESDQRLGAARRFASLSELGDQLLIAGGIDPGSTHHRSDAELFDPGKGEFAVERRTLAVPRARHAALHLPSGATLLIGGESDGGSALASVELVSTDPTRAPRALELLATPRIQPSALLLADGRILVGGGYAWAASASDPQAARQAIGSVEFLSFDLADGAGNLGPIRLDPAALDRAFVEIAAGSTLAVGGCDPLQRSSECLPCGSGCISRDVWWIDPQGSAHALEPLPAELAAAQPVLVPAADGSPWLIANGQLARFDPWQARFVAADELLPAPISAQRPSPIALGPGLFVWLQQRGDALELFGLQSSQRGPWTQDVAPLLVGSGLGLVPHLPPSSASADGAASLRYVTATGLQLSGSSAAASIADTDYASFTLDLTLAAGPAPLLRLAGTAAAAGESAAFGGLECAWPDFEAPEVSGPVRLRVQRRGDLVSLLLPSAEGADASPPAPCRRTLPERVRVELLGTPLGTTRLTRVEIRRSL
jgi:hypothetical protein